MDRRSVRVAMDQGGGLGGVQPGDGGGGVHIGIGRSGLLARLALLPDTARLRAALRGWLRRRLSPRYLKPMGVRHRAARQEPRND